MLCEMEIAEMGCLGGRSVTLAALTGPHGQRFLMIQTVEPEQPATQIRVVLNWFEELKRRVPGK